MQNRISISWHRKLLGLLGLSELLVLLAAILPAPPVLFWGISVFFLLQAMAYSLTLLYLTFRDPDVLGEPLFGRRFRPGSSPSLPLR